MSGDQTAEQAKRDRSPAFPYIGLGKAVERIQIIATKAKRYEVRVADIAKDWGLTPKSSSTDRNVAALLAYGLVEDSGGGENRKIKLTDAGSRILDDKRPGVREALLAEAALKPKIVAEYANRWPEGRPDDEHAISQLRFEGGFTDEGARKFLGVYDETIQFVNRAAADKIDASEPEKALPPARAKVGDLIQWINAGVEQFKVPARVIGLSDDGAWLWVEDSQTGIPVSEIQIVASNATPPAPAGGKIAPPMPLNLAVGLAPPKDTRGVREEKFALAEGDVVIRFPDNLSSDSVSDLEAYMQVFLKKARRAAGTKPSDVSPN